MALNLAGFDSYDRKARIAPGLLTVFPLAVVVVSLGLRKYPAVAAFSGLLVAAGGAYLMAILVRQLGRRIEAGLWQSWGGAMTTQLLRTRTTGGNAVLRDASRSAIEGLTGIRLLSATEEAADAARADEAIEAAVRQVLYLGRDEKNVVLKAENIQYGFERNFYATRTIGRGVATACVLSLIAALLFGPVALGGEKIANSALVVALILDSLWLVVWVFAPSRDRVKSAAERYADQLMQAAIMERKRENQETGVPRVILNGPNSPSPEAPQA